MPACRLLDGRPKPLVIAKGGQRRLLVLGVAQLALHCSLDVLKHDAQPLLADHRPDLAWEEHLLVDERVRVVLRDPARTERVQLLQHQHEEVPLGRETIRRQVHEYVPAQQQLPRLDGVCALRGA